MGKGGVSPDYFKYKMTISEAALYMDGLNMRDRTAWQTTRWLIWSISKMMGAKADSPEEFVRFSWEKVPEISDEEYERMMETLNEEKQRV